MRHLINPIFGSDLSTVANEMNIVHTFLVRAARASAAALPSEDMYWGAAMKRARVLLDPDQAPRHIGKGEEKLQEIINIVASLEHLLAALYWFRNHGEFGQSLVAECHPSTSGYGSNDLVLARNTGHRVAICEVTDVVSNRASQNKNERKALERLDVLPTFSELVLRRFIVTSVEFAAGLCSNKRAWGSKNYRYKLDYVKGYGQSRLLEVMRSDV